MQVILSAFLSCLLLLLPSSHAFAAGAGLPPWFTLASGITTKDVSADERYGEALVPTRENPRQVVRGRRWEANLKWNGEAGDDAGKLAWQQWKPALLKGGWKVVEERDRNPLSVSLRLGEGRNAWANLTLIAANDIRLDLVEVGENRLRLTLPPPGAKAEALKDDGNPFPFLPPPPGAKFTHAEQNGKPMLVTLLDKEGETRVQVATGSISKYYRTPKELSNLDFALAYRDALLAAGWTVPRISHGVNQSDAVLVAHYGANGRNLWAELNHVPGEMQLHVGDAGRDDLAQALKRDCRITLLGVLFDFDKATLKPESNATLARAQAAIAANPGLALEVQGHTDAVGGDAYNQKLSEARARSVLAWLVAKGAAAAQLTARGYGKTRPVADNETDDGRARNRRVELACRT